MPAPPPKAPADPRAAQDASGRARSAGDALAEECAALEEEVEELKVKYEMYFLGVELREPAKWREELKRKVLRIKEQFTRNTGLRFRLQSLHARFLSYERLWLRGAREREDGTYRRDLAKARRHQRGPAGPAAGAAGARQGRPARGQAGSQGPHEAEDVDLSDFGGESEAGQAASPTSSAARAGPGAVAAVDPAASAGERAPASTQPDRLAAPVLPPVRPLEPGPRPAAGPGAAPRGQPAPAQRPAAAASAGAAAARPPERPAATAAGGLGDAQLRELYDAYVSAKRRCNEDTSRITFDAVASTVSRQVPEIMKQHKARAVEFKVVIKDGRAKLVAVPKG